MKRFRYSLLVLLSISLIGSGVFCGITQYESNHSLSKNHFVSEMEYMHLPVKTYNYDDSTIIELKQKYKAASIPDGSLLDRLSMDWLCINKENDRNPFFKKLTFQKNGMAFCTFINSRGETELIKLSYFLLHDKKQEELPGRKPMLLLVTEENRVIPCIDVSVDYDSRFVISLGKLLKFYDLNGKEYIFYTKTGNNNKEVKDSLAKDRNVYKSREK